MMIKFQLSTEGKIYRMFELLREVPVMKKTSMLRILEQLKRNRRMLLENKEKRQNNLHTILFHHRYRLIHASREENT
jgi:hypothetical protein